MSGQHAREVTWRISGYDLQVHAFYEIHEVDASQALCLHTVPADRLVDPDNTNLAPRRCVTCLLIHGGDLAEGREEGNWR